MNENISLTSSNDSLSKTLLQKFQETNTNELNTMIITQNESVLVLPNEDGPQTVRDDETSDINLVDE